MEWAIPRLGDCWLGDWGRASTLIHEKDGEILAVVVYNNWNPGNSAELSVAAVDGRQWLTRPFLFAVFANPFLEWGCRRVWSVIDDDNHKSIKLCSHLGFQQEGRIRQGAGPAKDKLIFGMLKDECRYIEGDFSHGFEGESASGA